MKIRQLLRNRRVRLALVVVGGWALVVLVGWLALLLPIQVRNLIADKGSAALGKDLRVQRVTFNVFRLRATVEGILISEPNGGPALVTVDRLVANLSCGSLFHRGIVLDEVIVEQPMAWVVRRADGSINLAEIGAKPDAPKPPAEEPSEPMAVLLKKATLVGGAVRLDDETVGVTHVIHGLDLSVGRVSTRPEDKENEILVAITDGRINWASLTALIKAKPFADTPAYVVADLGLNDVDVTHYLPYAPMPEGLRVNSARIDLGPLNVEAELPAGATPRVLVSTNFRLRDVDCTEADSQPLLQLKSLALRVAPSRPLAGDVKIATLALDDPHVWVSRSKNGELNWLRATRMAEAASPAPAAVPEDPTPAAAPEKKSELPRIRLGVFALNRLVVDVADHAADAPFATELIPVSFTLKDLDTAPDKEGTVSLSGTSRFGETFDLTGEFSPNPLTFDLRFEGGPFPIAEYAPYYRHLAAVDVTAGTVSTGLRVKMVPDGGIEVSDGHVEVADFVAVARSDRRELVKIPAFSVEGAAASTAARTASVGKVALANARVNVKRLADGRLDVQTLLPEPASPAAAAPAPEEAAAPAAEGDAPPFVVSLAQLSVENFGVGFADASVKPAFAADLSVDVEASSLSTAANTAGEVKVKLAETDGVSLSADANLGLNPLRAELRTALADLMPKRYAAYFTDAVNFDIQSGVVGASARVVLPVEGVDRLTVSDAAVSLADFALAGKGEKEAFATLKSFSVSGVSVAMADRQLAIGQVALSGARLSAERAADGSVDVAAWLAPVGGESGESPAATSAPAEVPAASSPWQVGVAKLSLADVHLAAKDLAVGTPVDVGLGVSLTAGGISTASDAAPADLALALALDGGGAIRLDGTASIAKSAADLQVAIEDLALQPFEPYLRDQADVMLKAGTVWTKGTLAVDAGGDKPQVHWHGDSGIRSFALIEPTTASRLLNWEALSVTGVDFQLDPMKIRVAEVALAGPYAGLSAASDGTLNVQRILVGEATDKTAAPEAAQPPAPAAAAAEPVDLDIARVKISGGGVSFRDGTVTPAADHQLQDLDLELTNFSMRNQGLADLSVTGKLGTGASLTVQGRLRPTPLLVDAEVQLGGYQLPPLSPYSGRYIARDIGQGRLALDLKYKVDGTKLKGDNVVTLDQFELGNKVESPDAIELPLGLAIALLKDTDGQILIDLPVEGDLADPAFNPWRVVWRVLRNLIVKAAASPFKMLGALAGSDKPLDVVPFVAGSTALDDEALARMKALATALSKRPGVKIGIGGAAVASDRQALRDQGYDALLRGQKAQQMLAAGAGAASAQEISLTAEERPALAAAAYRAATLPVLPPLPETADAAAVAARNEEIHAALLGTVTVADEDLLTLANGRAAAILAWFTSEGIAKDRLFLREAEIIQDEQPQVRFKMQ